MRTVTVRGKKYHYTLERHDSGYIAICKELPDVDAFGKTMSEIEKELAKAISGYLEVFPNSALELTV